MTYTALVYYMCKIHIIHVVLKSMIDVSKLVGGGGGGHKNYFY
jgi:hypothetical protein